MHLHYHIYDKIILYNLREIANLNLSNQICFFFYISLLMLQQFEMREYSFASIIIFYQTTALFNMFTASCLLSLQRRAGGGLRRTQYFLLALVIRSRDPHTYEIEPTLRSTLIIPTCLLCPNDRGKKQNFLK